MKRTWRFLNVLVLLSVLLGAGHPQRLRATTGPDPSVEALALACAARTVETSPEAPGWQYGSASCVSPAEAERVLAARSVPAQGPAPLALPTSETEATPEIVALARGLRGDLRGAERHPGGRTELRLGQGHPGIFLKQAFVTSALPDPDPRNNEAALYSLVRLSSEYIYLPLVLR